MKTHSFSFAIFCKSEINGQFSPTQWGTFDSRAAANDFAARNIKHTAFMVDIVD